MHFKKYKNKIMKKLTTIVLGILASLAMTAQTTFGLKLSEVSNDGNNYIVKIEMQMQGDNPEVFKLGSSSLQFEFPNEVLSNPVLESSNFVTPIYLNPTVTNPLPHLCSFNIELAIPSVEQTLAIAQAPNWTALGEIRFTVENNVPIQNLNWSYNGGTTATVVYLDDESTQIYLTNDDENYLIFDEGTDVGITEFSLGNKLQVVPNPMTSVSTIILNDNLLKYPHLVLQITNNLGQIVQTKTISPQEKTLFIKRNNLPSGIYHLQLITDKTLLVSSEVVVK